MPSEFPMNDPQALWQSQPTEPLTLKAEALRRRAQRRQTSYRLGAAFGIVVGLILFVFFAHAVRMRDGIVVRLGYGVSSLWSLYFAYQAYRWTWPRRPDPDLTMNATVQSYRSELEKRRDYVQHIWNRAGLTFCFLGVGLVVMPDLINALRYPKLLGNFAPLFGLLVMWWVAFVLIRKKSRQRLQREIEELSEFKS